MAATKISDIHKSAGKSVAKSIDARIDYIENPDKTKNHELISTYGCGITTAGIDFMLTKEQYAKSTGRDQGDRDRIAYLIRQSFKPGEVDAETANKIGYELAKRYTNGEHQFVVCTHIDRRHFHNHIFVNSTAIDCLGKFRDVKKSARVIRELSDELCAEYGLSVIENPQKHKSKSYNKWLGDIEKPPTGVEILRAKIDELIPTVKTFAELLTKLRVDGCKVSEKQKHISVILPGRKKSIRLDTLRGDYTEAKIRERLNDVAPVEKSKPKVETPKPQKQLWKVKLKSAIDATLSFQPESFQAFIDKIQSSGYEVKRDQRGVTFRADGQKNFSVLETLGGVYAEIKIRERLGDVALVIIPDEPAPKKLIDMNAAHAKGRGYEKWASVYNAKQIAQTLVFLEENNLPDVPTLLLKTDEAIETFNALDTKLKVLDAKMKSGSEFQKHITQYGKTRSVYAEYKKSGWSRKFRAAHEAEIALHQSCKKYFDALGITRLPTIASLRTDYAAMQSERKTRAADLRTAKDAMVKLVTAKSNVEKILDETAEPPDVPKIPATLSATTQRKTNRAER
jgi:hypothetical protein